jgi:predicted small lipoprotein YifL
MMIRLIACLVFCAALAACGQKGPLVPAPKSFQSSPDNAAFAPQVFTTEKGFAQ